MPRRVGVPSLVNVRVRVRDLRLRAAPLEVLVLLDVEFERVRAAGRSLLPQLVARRRRRWLERRMRRSPKAWLQQMRLLTFWVVRVTGVMDLSWKGALDCG